MARKNIGSTLPRKKKTGSTVESAAVQPTNGQAAPEAVQNMAAVDAALGQSLNLDEEIRRRAYELFLERNGAAGDPDADWFIAEREVRSRYEATEHSSALAASQGRS